MYIEQIKNKDFNFILYLPVLLSFFGLMAANFFMTQDMSTDDLMHQMISQWGTNVTIV